MFEDTEDGPVNEMNDQAYAARQTRRGVMKRAATGVAGAAAVPGFAAMAGCGALGSSPAPQSAPVSVTYISHLGETHPEGKGYLDLLEEYNRSNQEKITVKLEEARPATGYDKMLTLSAA